MKKIILTLAFLSAVKAFAGTDVGNGGDVVVCKDKNNKITSVELLDFFEARVVNNYVLKHGAYSLPLEEKVKVLIDRMGISQKDKVALYAKLNLFFKEAAILDNINLIDVNDSAHVAVPVGCSIEQIAIQVEPQTSLAKRYTVSKFYWDRIDDFNKAGLIFHEIIYGLNLPAENSRGVRMMVGLSAADLLKELVDLEAAQFYKSFSLCTMFRYNNEINFCHDQTEFWPNGNLKTFYESSSSIIFAGQRLSTLFASIPMGTISLDEQGHFRNLKGILQGVTNIFTDATGEKFQCSGEFNFVDGIVRRCDLVGSSVRMLMEKKGGFIVDTYCAGKPFGSLYSRSEHGFMCTTDPAQKTYYRDDYWEIELFGMIALSGSEYYSSVNTMGDLVSVNVGKFKYMGSAIEFDQIKSTDEYRAGYFRLKSDQVIKNLGVTAKAQTFLRAFVNDGKRITILVLAKQAILKTTESKDVIINAGATVEFEGVRVKKYY